MPFTVAELTNIANSALDVYLGKGEVYKQNIQNKPLIAEMDAGAKTFAGGKGSVSLAVKAGQGGLTLSGYTHDDVVSYGNPASTKRISFPWREHFIGMGLTHTELKTDGITVVETDAKQSMSDKSGREEFALANKGLRKWECLFDLLISSNRNTCCDRTNEWDKTSLICVGTFAGHAVGKDDLHCATAFGIATDEPLLFEDIELVFD